MSYMEKLKKIIEDGDGLIFTKEIVANGIPKRYLSQLVIKGEIERIAHGVYETFDTLSDKMYYLQHRITLLVFSHDTALFLHDLSDRDPLTYSVTVPNGYNTKKLKKIGLVVFSVKKDHYKIGLTTMTTPFGRKVVTYNMERTLCDIIRSRSKMDIAIITDAMKRYVRRRDKNLPKLMEYADIFRVTNLIRNYLEVLL
jgi:predicted transcriptional regulator of viral defense system